MSWDQLNECLRRGFYTRDEGRVEGQNSHILGYFGNPGIDFLADKILSLCTLEGPRKPVFWATNLEVILYKILQNDEKRRRFAIFFVLWDENFRNCFNDYRLCGDHVWKSIQAGLKIILDVCGDISHVCESVKLALRLGGKFPHPDVTKRIEEGWNLRSLECVDYSGAPC